MENSHQLMQGERIDEIGFGKLCLIQEPQTFCYGIDSVLLASYAKVKRGSNVCDLGTGTGIIPLILSHKTEASTIWGIEVQADSYQRAVRNVELNQLSDRLRILHSDVLDTKHYFKKGSFDVVVSNPPYMGNANGLKNVDEKKKIARHETSAGLEDFISAAAYLLKDKGDFYLVHRPSRLVDICHLGRNYRLEPKRIRFVCPSYRKKPNILLTHFVKYGRPELKFEEPLFVYEEDGSYTEEILKIYERK
ncbi:tRNA1(Val) (adenine(37)-N6)-methyltransferase [Sinanaerobacter sp. ZZT-01]|uniref:tRNA1(Val) (adenine(37)-N6)-methyltransferase n=1 Tax=Sinanaerobacter sp. ZZT-01 TaxID=3111540 RepID=UPI002D786C05|nr:tRNA1(Val) (adenine(37)-N6)-methyltransferase [Sinanaerobacter sp. ZZT-01]WRR92204.1 tRNA1(Val) (adenine(37)-N6)-methyltransferase [Sinanaerobacter sp. ZZT-01]